MEGTVLCHRYPTLRDGLGSIQDVFCHTLVSDLFSVNLLQNFEKQSVPFIEDMTWVSTIYQNQTPFLQFARSWLYSRPHWKRQPAPPQRCKDSNWSSSQTGCKNSSRCVIHWKEKQEHRQTYKSWQLEKHSGQRPTLHDGQWYCEFFLNPFLLHSWQRLLETLLPLPIAFRTREWFSSGRTSAFCLFFLGNWEAWVLAFLLLWLTLKDFSQTSITISRKRSCEQAGSIASFHRANAFVTAVSCAQKNSCLHHFLPDKDGEYDVLSWSAVSTPPMFLW